MRPRERWESGQSDLFRARLDQIVDLNHALAKLARAIDWGFLERTFGAVYADVPRRPVCVVTGDGEQLMGLGGLVTIAVARPGNLTIAVLDNGHFGETGMQASHTGLGVDLAAVAAGAGFPDVTTVTDLAALAAWRPRLHDLAAGPRFARIRISPDTPPRVLPPRDGVHVKNRLRRHLGFAVA